VPAPAAGLGFEILEDVGGGAPKLERRFGGDRLDVRAPANASVPRIFLGALI